MDHASADARLSAWLLQPPLLVLNPSYKPCREVSPDEPLQIEDIFSVTFDQFGTQP